MSEQELPTAIHYVHSIWFVMLATGVLGGLLSYYIDKGEGKGGKNKSTKPWQRHLITGVLATFMVPLFLQMIGSGLLKELSPQHYNFFVFLGFCSAAAFIAQHFATSVSTSMLKDTQKEAHQAKADAEEAVKISQTNVQRAETLKVDNYKIKGALHFQSKDYDKALNSLNRYLKHYPDDSHSLWRKAYILKRKNLVQEAFELVDKAIKHEHESDASILYYNRACYSCLLNHKVESIIADLQKAFSLDCDNLIEGYIRDDLTVNEEDPNNTSDLISIKDDPKFVDFLQEKNINIDTQKDAAIEK